MSFNTFHVMCELLKSKGLTLNCAARFFCVRTSDMLGLIFILTSAHFTCTLYCTYDEIENLY